jgi:hypothetical protein
MILLKRYWSHKEIIAGTHKINKKKDMISYQAIYSFIVGDCIPWTKLDNYFTAAVSADNSSCLVE